MVLSTRQRPARSRISLYRCTRGGGLTKHKSTLLRFPRFAIYLALLSCATGPADASVKRPGRAARVQTGIDVLEVQQLATLRRQHIGLITNHTGVHSQGRSTIEVLSHALCAQLVALFSPEHGLAGRNDDRISSSKDPSTGLPVYSLYGETL